jgi:hypothetical protein
VPSAPKRASSSGSRLPPMNLPTQGNTGLERGSRLSLTTEEILVSNDTPPYRKNREKGGAPRNGNWSKRMEQIRELIDSLAKSFLSRCRDTHCCPAS